MARKATTPAQPEPQQAKAAPERKITIEKHRRSCVKLYGISPSTFDGATVGLSGSFTVEEMRARIKEWLGKEVK